MWFLRSNTNQITVNEVMFQHLNVIKVGFDVSDYVDLRVDPLNYTNLTSIATTGYNRWFFL